MLVSLDELGAFAEEFVQSLPKKEGTQAHVVGLSGDLGAGKTTLVQHIARALGVHDAVTSPTFVIAERYTIARSPFTSLVHIDAYRLTPDEAHTIGWEEFSANPKNVVLVEWPENLGQAFPADARILALSVVDDHTRSISYAR